MPRKRLAAVLSQAEYTYNKNLLTGLIGEAFRNDFDVCVFTTFIKDGTPDEYRLGEANIFNLLNAEKFDGVILVPDSIKFIGVTDKIVADFRTLHLPLVTIDYQIDDIPCIWSGDSDDIEKLVDHLIDVHGCKVIDFISGIKDHPHSLNREAGYVRSLEKHGIAVDPQRIHYGDFTRENSGVIADDILGSGRSLPQGIAGACDSSSEALAQELISRGYSVPGDFSIVGYDTTSTSLDTIGAVTTMYRNSGDAGVKAVRYLYHELYGKDTDSQTVSDQNDIITSESCGCGPANKKPNYNCNNRIDDVEVTGNEYYSTYNFMMEDLIAIDSYEDFFWNLDWYTRYINSPDGIYICTCDEWMTESDKDQNGYRTTGYPDKVTQVYTFENGQSSVDPERIIDSKLMLPRLYDDTGKPSVYYFTPLHFNDRCFGYTVLQYINRPTVFNDEFASWMRNVDNAFESMRRRLTMKYLYESRERLKAFSVTDSLTGIYNRNGYNSIAVEMFEIAKDENKGFFMLVGDMNNLKTINDTYGHIEGDESIKATANAIQSACDVNEKCFRIGGDEFIIIGAGEYTDASIREKLSKVEEHLKDHNQKSGKPYRVSISLGYKYAPANSFDSIKDALASADEKMFANKQEYKSRHN